MSLENDINLFRGIPLLSEFTDEQLRLLAFGAEDRNLAVGTILFEAGDRADSGYIIASGRIEIRSADDTELLMMVKPGAMIGETALLTETFRRNRAVVGEQTMVVQIRRSLFRRILSEYPDLAKRLYDSFARQLTGTISDLNRVRESLRSLDGEPGETLDG